MGSPQEAVNIQMDQQVGKRSSHTRKNSGGSKSLVLGVDEQSGNKRAVLLAIASALLFLIGLPLLLSTLLQALDRAFGISILGLTEVAAPTVAAIPSIRYDRCLERTGLLAPTCYGNPGGCMPRVYSQRNEDGALSHLFGCIGHGEKQFLEISDLQEGTEASSRLLREWHQWNGTYLVRKSEFPSKASGIDASIWHRESISPKNIVSIFKKYKIKQNLDLISVECQQELFVVREILRADYRPRLLMMPYNRNFGSHQSFTVADTEQRDVDNCYFGSSALAITRVVAGFGYTPVWVNGHSIVFVLSEEITRKQLTHMRPSGLLLPFEPKLGKQCVDESKWFEVPKRANKLAPDQTLDADSFVEALPSWELKHTVVSDVRMFSGRLESKTPTTAPTLYGTPL